MAQVHSIDGTTMSYISYAPWGHPKVDEYLNRISVFQRWRPHTWEADVMPMSDWETLITKRGTLVTIVTPDPDDPNADYVTYYGAKVQAVTAGGHEARHMRGVRVEFLVRV